MQLQIACMKTRQVKASRHIAHRVKGQTDHHISQPLYIDALWRQQRKKTLLLKLGYGDEDMTDTCGEIIHPRCLYHGLFPVGGNGGGRQLVILQRPVDFPRGNSDVFQAQRFEHGQAIMDMNMGYALGAMPEMNIPLRCQTCTGNNRGMGSRPRQFGRSQVKAAQRCDNKVVAPSM